MLNKIENLKPVKKGAPRTKVGRLNLKGKLNGKPVKVFECANTAHANFVHDLMNNADFESYFPKSLSTHENFVICEWTPGDTVEGNRFFQPDLTDFLDNAEKILSTLHTQDAQKSAGFDYIEDFIKPRFDHCCDSLDLPDLKQKIHSSLDVLYGLSENNFCAHPDLTPANVVFRKNGVMKIIDNELLGQSRLPVLDELNLLNALPERTIKKHTEQLKTLMRKSLELMNSEHANDLFNVWMMRKLGSDFVAGNIPKVLGFAEKDAQDKCTLWNALKTLSK